jgi:hypothetical protein
VSTEAEFETYDKFKVSTGSVVSYLSDRDCKSTIFINEKSSYL